MKKSSLFLFIALSLVIILSNVSYAITIEASPSPALINQSVTAKVAVPYVSCSPKCDTEINFGDDASWPKHEPGRTSLRNPDNRGHIFIYSEINGQLHIERKNPDMKIVSLSEEPIFKGKKLR